MLTRYTLKFIKIQIIVEAKKSSILKQNTIPITSKTAKNYEAYQKCSVVSLRFQCINKALFPYPFMKRPVPKIEDEEDPLSKLIEEIAFKNELYKKQNSVIKKYSISSVDELNMDDQSSDEVSQTFEENKLDNECEQNANNSTGAFTTEDLKIVEPEKRSPFLHRMETFVTMKRFSKDGKVASQEKVVKPKKIRFKLVRKANLNKKFKDVLKDKPEIKIALKNPKIENSLINLKQKLRRVMVNSGL